MFLNSFANFLSTVLIIEFILFLLFLSSVTDYLSWINVFQSFLSHHIVSFHFLFFVFSFFLYTERWFKSTSLRNIPPTHSLSPHHSVLIITQLEGSWLRKWEEIKIIMRGRLKEICDGDMTTGIKEMKYKDSMATWFGWFTKSCCIH